MRILFLAKTIVQEKKRYMSIYIRNLLSDISICLKVYDMKYCNGNLMIMNIGNIRIMLLQFMVVSLTFHIRLIMIRSQHQCNMLIENMNVILLGMLLILRDIIFKKVENFQK